MTCSPCSSPDKFRQEDTVKLRQRLATGELIVIPGVPDLMSAIIADKLGFEFIYGSGYWLMASAYGLPDAGIATYSQMLGRMETLTSRCKAALIADGDTGYGGLLNVRETVRGYEKAGVAAIQLEDQAFPKACGQEGAKKVISTEEMVRKIQVAVDTRDGMLIIARSDARKAEGFEAMLNRLQAYVEAGADIVLPEAVTGPDELQKTIEVLQVPVMANMAHGGATPMMSPQTLSDMGCALSIYPSFASLASLAATETALRALQLNISSGERAPPLYDFAEFGRLIGLDDVADFDRFWA